MYLYIYKYVCVRYGPLSQHVATMLYRVGDVRLLVRDACVNAHGNHPKTRRIPQFSSTMLLIESMWSETCIAQGS